MCSRLGWLSHAWSEPGLHSAKHAAHVTIFFSIIIVFTLGSGALNGASTTTSSNTDNNIDPVDQKGGAESEDINSRVPQPLLFFLQLLRLLPILALPQVSANNLLIFLVYYFTNNGFTRQQFNQRVVSSKLCIVNMQSQKYLQYSQSIIIIIGILSQQ